METPASYVPPNSFRVMRMLTVHGVCGEIAPATYVLNAVAELLDTPAQEGATRNLVDLMFPIGGNLVRQLRGPGGLSQFPDGPENVTPFRATYGPMSMFEYFEQDLEHKSAFDSYMAGRASWGRRQWFDIVDIEQGVMLGCRKDRDAVFAVHVGGGKGLDLTNFRNRYPDCPGRCILQELPKTLESVQPVPESVELMPHDFFTAQPIQGACLNLLNAMLYDWSEGRCRKILHRTAQAMEPGYSRLFIQEMISKEMGESFRGAALDILMFMVPEEQSGHSGLKVVKLWSGSEGGESIVEAELTDRTEVDPAM
ncbi:MAG: hypothetical protein Q9159_004861 [Coniocarpon cinnabarinum]